MRTDLFSAIRPALVMTLLFALLTGIVYPFVTLGIGQAVFPTQANGSLLVDKGRVIGSALIGQTFAADRYFHGRPSAAGKGYDATASSGSNLGPASQALADRVRTDVAALHPVPDRQVPPDLVTTSASGLDPHISPEAAFYQVDRVARARGVDRAAIERLVDAAIERPLFGFLGEAHINVLTLNHALDAQTEPLK